MDARLMSRPTRRVRQLLPLNPDYQSGTGTDNGADGIDYPSGPYKPILTPFGVPAVTYGTPAEGTDLTAIRTDAVLAPPEVDELANIDTTGKADGDVIYWDAGSSTWLVAAPSGGGGVTVQDEGSPLTTTATTLDFVGAGVTATGAGATKTITIPGGGGGTDYDVSPNPTGDDDEFKAALSGWTTLGSLNDSNTSDLYGHLHLRKATVGLQLHGVYKAAPSMPFTATIKLSDYSIRRGNYTNFGLAVGDATPTAWCSFTLGTFNNAVIRDTWTNNTTRASTANGTNDDAREHPNYLRIVVNSSTSIDCWISTDGLVWTRELSGVNPGFTVSKIGIVVQANGQEADSYFDWIRFGSSVVQSPSRLIGGGAGVTVQDEGSPLTTTATTLNFTGSGVTASGSGATKTIDIPGVGASTYPASVEGLFAWYKADAISGLSNGATMTEWRNSAPLATGLDLIAIGAPTYQTNVQNSLPVVRFGGSAYFAHNLGAPLMANKPWTIIIAHKLSAISQAYTGLWGFGWSDAGGIFIKSNGKSAVYATGSIYDGTGAITYGTTNWNYTTAVMGPTITTRRNGSADITAGTMAINGSLQGLGYLGNQAAASRVYNGDIAEVLIYARVLNSTEYAAVESYLASKWSI
jgi:hypothetical protein